MRQEKKGRLEGKGGEKIEGRLISSLFHFIYDRKYNTKSASISTMRAIIFPVKYGDEKCLE